MPNDTRPDPTAILNRTQRPTRVYVAGPIAIGNREENIRRAIDAGEVLHAAGYVPFVPHLNELWSRAHPHTWDEWLAMDLEWVQLCDAVLVLPGESRGVELECEFAAQANIPCFTSTEALFAALPNRKSTEFTPREVFRSIDAWQEIAYQHSFELGFHTSEDDNNPNRLSVHLLNLVSEVTEAWDHWRNGAEITTVSETYRDGVVKPDGVPVELADVFLRLMDTCKAYSIPLSRAVARKMEFNLTRGHRNGGKRC